MLPESAPAQPSHASEITIASPGSVSACEPAQWNGLNSTGSPFLSWSFLSGLEHQGLVGRDSGWRSRPLLALLDGKPLGALPVYEKAHSFGEFVFDWAWAEAYTQVGLAYYPKLVIAVPYTPVPGPRVLSRDPDAAAIAAPALLAHLRQRLEQQGQSSIHVLFNSERETDILQRSDLLPRLDCRFLWRNRGYSDFEEFLAVFSSRQRKNIRRERRKVSESGVRFSWRTGAALSDLDWEAVHSLCAQTFYRYGHRPYLNAGFLQSFASQCPRELLVCCGHLGQRLVTAAIFFRDQTTLYGRYWGSSETIDCLHFEACYYQGIEYAIEQRLARFDPGTQGEHKLRRGFAPIASWSAHYFHNPGMQAAISHWLRRERRLVRQYITERRAQMPFDDGAEVSA